MPIQRRHFDQLCTAKSWSSSVAVLAHIDLDAFYAQCLTVHYGYNPAEPLGCRQWDALIAINYPARKFGLKRGVSVEEATKLCPGIHLPHVATFKKGELSWDFHDSPDASNYKVSLDHFRRESRKIFAVFKEHFRCVEKAGIDEGFVDLGPEVHKEVLQRFPNLAQNEDDIPLSHDELLDIGAELVLKVRLQIHEKFQYTCSAGIAPNKQLAKLGSGYNKPFNQTVVHSTDMFQFLSKFRITDAWGWGGKLGKEVLAALNIGEDVEDQCKFVRDNFSKTDLQHALKGDVILAQTLFDMVRGQHSNEFHPRTLIKSMAAVKNFTRNGHLKSYEDVEAWILVFAADLSGRLWDLQEDLGNEVVPKTITLRQFKAGQLISRQNHFRFSGTALTDFREQIFSQASAIAKSWVLLPCTYLVVEISNLYELPRERLAFKANTIAPSEPSPSKKHRADDSEEQLFVGDLDELNESCTKCGKAIPQNAMQEHLDWHFAKSLQQQEGNIPTSPPASSPRKEAKKKSPAKKKKLDKPIDKNKDQKSILEFFRK